MKNHLKFLFAISLMLLLLIPAMAQKKWGAKNTTFKGKVLEKPWTKSTESYCAQGSEYFVLQMSNNEEIVLKNTTALKLKDFEGKKVSITGVKETKTIKSKNDDMGQRPISQEPISIPVKDGEKEKISNDFTCTVLVINKIKLDN